MKRTVNSQASSKSCKKKITATVISAVCMILAYIAQSGIGPSLIEKLWPSDNKPPSAEITKIKQEGIIPFEVIFNGSKSLDPEGKVLTFRWMIDGMEISTKESLKHRFDSPGKYNVVLEVKDDKGKIGKDSMVITVSVNKKISIHPNDINVSQTVPVSNVGSGDVYIGNINVNNGQKNMSNQIKKDKVPVYQLKNNKTAIKYKISIHAPGKSKIYIDGKQLADEILYIDINQGTHELLARKNNITWKVTEYIDRDRFFNILESEMH